MTQNSHPLQRLSLLGLGALFVLLLGGIIAWKERVFFCDASYIAYNILKYDRLFIQEHRYGSFITQIVPLLGGKMHLPVSIIVPAYAISFNLFYLAVGFVIYRCRQYGLLLLMGLTYTLLVSDDYYWTNNEIHQALAWMFLFFAVVLRMGQLKKPLYILLPVVVLLAAITIYTHFIAIIPFSFLWIYFWIQGEYRNWKIGTTVLLTACIIIIIACKFLIVEGISYDAQHLHNVTHFSVSDVLKAARADVVKTFVKRMFTLYWIALPVFASGLFALFSDKKHKLLLFTLLACTGYFIIMGLEYAVDGGSILLFHIESEWASLAVILAAPFVYSFLPRLSLRHAVVILCVIFLVRFAYITASYPKFAWRTNFREKVMAHMQQKSITKLGVIAGQDVRERYLLDWGMPEESILMSAMQHELPQRTFCLIGANDSALKSALSVPGKVQIYYQPDHAGSLPTSYFRQDSSRPYAFITYEELIRQ